MRKASDPRNTRATDFSEPPITRLSKPVGGLKDIENIKNTGKFKTAPKSLKTSLILRETPIDTMGMSIEGILKVRPRFGLPKEFDHVFCFVLFCGGTGIRRMRAFGDRCYLISGFTDAIYCKPNDSFFLLRGSAA